MTEAKERAPVVAFRKVSKLYGEGEAQVRALDQVSFDIDHGQFVALMGPSGSGKSTCLNLIGALDVATGGKYFFRGIDVGTLGDDELAMLRRHYLGFVFQGFNLLPRTSALENVGLPLVYRDVPSAERRRRAMKALFDVGLAGRESAMPNELSGGQQQRVAIARALVGEPSLLLADEPTGNLDSARAHEILRLLRDLNEERGLTIAMVTHEPEMAAYADRTIRFFDGQLREPKPADSETVEARP